MSVMVRFDAADGTWLADIDDVVGVHLADQIRPLPAPADGVVGVIARDGQTWPVLSILSGNGQHVLLVAHGSDVVGLLADAVHGVTDVDVDRLSPRPNGQHTPFIRAVHDDTELAYVLDSAALVGGVSSPPEVDHD